MRGCASLEKPGTCGDSRAHWIFSSGSVAEADESPMWGGAVRRGGPSVRLSTRRPERPPQAASLPHSAHGSSRVALAMRNAS